MTEAVSLEPTVEEAAELRFQMGYYLTEMKRLNDQMARDQEQIEALKSESRVITAETRVLMESLQGTLSELRAA